MQLLHRVKNPGYYTGGEFGQREKPDASFTTAIIFPDVYEIGMSNYSWKILYSIINDLPGISCQRVFAPAEDFETLLREEGLPLFTLEGYLPLAELDVLGFTLGYELSATNMLTILDLGGIPVHRHDRRPDAPLVIIGGPGTTNPLPYYHVIDGAVIGEAEEVVPDLYRELARIQDSHTNLATAREKQRQVLLDHPNIWVPGSTKSVRRAVWTGFTQDALRLGYPVTPHKIIQEHGVVEIMRGCPQGCRFCHAGVYYRPYRQKSIAQITEEVRDLVDTMGYRRITLSSLSSGDYSGIGDLISSLNQEFGSRGVSFQLPSLKVESFTLPIIEALSHGKRGGLTFAVETPTDFGQGVLNKTVTVQRIIAILHEAERRGWKSAKFYFMVGLPVPGASVEDEAEEIQMFLRRIRQQTRMKINVNIGTFVPKPHTPFQWAGMLPWERAQEILHTIKTNNTDRGIKITYQGGFLSYLEGIISLGDQRVGDLIYAAWQKGARFDSWEDRCRRDIWEQVIRQASWPVDELLEPKQPEDTILPWDSISLGVSPRYIAKEWQKSRTGEHSLRCEPVCRDHCGLCGKSVQVVDQPENPDSTAPTITIPREDPRDSEAEILPLRHTLILRFQKLGMGTLLSHLSLIRAFEQALIRCDVPLWMAGHYNPKPKMDFNQALPLGMESRHEVMAVQLAGSLQAGSMIDPINAALPKGIRVTDLKILPTLTRGKKIPSLSSLTQSVVYRVYPKSMEHWARLESAVTNLEAWSVETDLNGDPVLRETRTTLGSWGIRKLPGQEAGYNPKSLGAILEKISTQGPQGKDLENTIEEWIAWEEQQPTKINV